MSDIVNGNTVFDWLEAAVKREGADHTYVKPEMPRTMLEEWQRDMEPAQQDGDDEMPSHWYHNADCLYFHGVDQPGCLVGNIMYHEFDVHEASGVEGQSARDAIKEMVQDSVEFSDLAFSILERAQSEQDHGHTWGEAVEIARKEFGSAIWEETVE